jgi:hypothetical protein
MRRMNRVSFKILIYCDDIDVYKISRKIHEEANLESNIYERLNEKDAKGCAEV